jgi:hypothetical protein
MNPTAVMALLLFCFCAFTGGLTVANAKPVIPRDGPPAMAPIDVKVEGRLPVRIVLRTLSLQRSPVKFVFRGEPEFGRVRLLKQLTADSVEVEYVPPADRTIVADSFGFAGANSQGFSSDCRARIQIIDLGPRLAVPLALDFAATQVGQSARLPLEVRNSGDQPAEGEISVSVPWEIEEGNDRYSLAPGEKKTVVVLFKPSRAGWAQGSVRFSGGASATVQVRAEAMDWVDVAKDPMDFLWGDTMQQTAELVLSNPGIKPLELTLETSPPLEHAASIRIEAGTSRLVPVRWRGDRVSGGWGTLLLSSPNGMRRVVVWSLDAILSGLGPSLILNGEPGSASARRTFTNTGGRSGSWTFRCTPPFYLSDAEHVPKEVPEPLAGAAASSRSPAKLVEAHATIPGFVWDHNQSRYIPSAGAPKAISSPIEAPKESAPTVPHAARATMLTRKLQPGESFVLFVGVTGNSLGSGGTFSVHGPGQRHDEPLLVSREGVQERARTKGNAGVPAAVKAAPTTPPAIPGGEAVSGASMPPPSASPLHQAAAALGVTALPSLFSKKTAAPSQPQAPPPAILQAAFLPGLILPGFRVKDVTSDSATIVFPAEPGVTPEHLVVRYREIHPVEGGEPRVEWLPFQPADRKGRRVGQNIEIRLRGLPPNWSSFVDLLGPPSAQGIRDRLYQTEIITLPADGVLSTKRPWLWLVLLGALGGAYFLRRRSIS